MKSLKALVVLLVVAGLVIPAAAMAEDRLSLSGQMRARAFHTDYDLDNGDTQTWANQRLRIAGKIAVAEGVSVTFRTDITEGTNWGDSSSFGTGPGNPERSNGFGHARSGSQQQWDRAHLDISKGIFHLRAGQQYIGSGGAFAIDTQDSGLALDMVFGPANVKLFGIVDKDGNKFTQDSFLTGVIADLKNDVFAPKIYLANYNDIDEDVTLIGANGTFDIAFIKLFGELDFFTGDADSTTDAMGTQFMLDGSMSATDAITVGAQFFYALAQDTDGSESQYVLLGNGFNGWDPIMDVGTSLSNEEISAGRVFDWTGEGAGATAGRLYASTKLGAIKLGASATYMTTEDSDIVDADAYALAGGLVYDILENTTFQLQLQYSDVTVDGYMGSPVTGEDYTAFEAGTGFFVNF